ncbi:hypothetical protein STEG23_006460 [Scotinomys teguina]
MKAAKAGLSSPDPLRPRPSPAQLQTNTSSIPTVPALERDFPYWFPLGLCDTMYDKGNLRDGRFVLAHSFRGFQVIMNYAVQIFHSLLRSPYGKMDHGPVRQGVISQGPP